MIFSVILPVPVPGYDEADGLRHRIALAPREGGVSQVGVVDVLARISAVADVRDLSIAEPDIEASRTSSAASTSERRW